MKIIIKKLLLLLLIVNTTVHAENENATTESKTLKYSDNKHFQISYTSKLDPIAINTMHTWTLHIENNAGEPVINADVAVNGGMPEHDHGLPTQPQVTQNLGNGNYLLEGLRFHMGGWWQVTITIHSNSISDSVTFDLQL